MKEYFTERGAPVMTFDYVYLDEHEEQRPYRRKVVSPTG